MFDMEGLKIKTQQFFECLLPIDKSRIGECQNCGRCCQLGMKCLLFSKSKNKCLIYKFRPLQCRKSPRTAKYLKQGCKGYKFVNE